MESVQFNFDKQKICEEPTRFNPTIMEFAAKSDAEEPKS